ncbi:MAG: putative sugar kinase of the RNAseH/HSP70 fold, partial [Proteobacteria bacterium]|nr:putative sugar kinase of the RNAseH/HSP70 fold [Pseudomonadota bacterium]
MTIDLMGWDIGGAHLKAAALAGETISAVMQKPCPLWLGMDGLHAATREILQELSPARDCLHVVTMTGELADLFANREEGVWALVKGMAEHTGTERLWVFAGQKGFLRTSEMRAEHLVAIASANWLATGLYAASRLSDALLIDIGSTTTDLLLLQNGQLNARGYTDHERMRYDELIYCGIVRTPLMSLDSRAPFDGEWVGLMAEHFATTADVYRLTGELPDPVDQMPAADGGEKTCEGSARRIARLLGRDLESADMGAWLGVARYFRERQLTRIQQACERQLSRGITPHDAPLVGAGVGRFLVQELANRLSHPYLDIT